MGLNVKIYYPTAHSGELVLPKPQQESKRSYLLSVDNKPLVEEIKLWRPKKSWNQVKAIFGLALKIVKTEYDDRGWDTSMLFRLEKPTGIGVTADLLKVYFYSVCPIFNSAGNPITLSDEEVTTERAAKFLTDIQAWASSQWSIYIPDPDKNWQQSQK